MVPQIAQNIQQYFKTQSDIQGELSMQYIAFGWI